jgi:RNA recognition motif-containing protein
MSSATNTSRKLDMSLDEIIAIEGIAYNHDMPKTGRQAPPKRARPPKPSAEAVSSGRPLDTVLRQSMAVTTQLGHNSDSDGNRSRHHFDGHCGRVFVDNLKYEVVDEDLRLLFRAFGPLKRAAVNYKRDGRSEGTALVVFERKEDALKAYATVNGALIDGRAIRLSLLDSAVLPMPMANRPQIVATGQRALSSGAATTANGSANRQVWTDIATNFDDINGSDDDIKAFREKRFRGNDN